MKPFLCKKIIQPCVYFKQLFAVADPHPQRLAVLDGLRALAILYLILFHAFQLRLYTLPDADKMQLLAALPWWQQWLAFGDKGVDIFFVLSGFLIASLLFKEFQQHQRINMPRFLWHRFLRLSPLYYGLIVVFFIQAAPWVERHFYTVNLIYLNNILPLSKQYIPWAWSLAVEMQFYVLLMLYIPVFFKLPAKGLQLVILLFLSCAWRVWLLLQDSQLNMPIIEVYSRPSADINHYVETLYISFFTRSGPLIVGVISAFLVLFHVNFINRFNRHFLQILALALLALILFSPFFSVVLPDTVNLLFHAGHRLIFACAMALIILSYWAKGQAKGVLYALSWSGYSVIAKLSYAMFLGHLPVLLGLQSLLAHWLNQWSFITGIYLLFALSLPIILLTSVVVHCFIERPFMALRR